MHLTDSVTLKTRRTHESFHLSGGFQSAFSLNYASFSTAEAPKKGKLNTDLFEKESSESSVSGKVKAVRVVQEETEVFIDNPKGNSGPYVLPQNIKNRAGILKTLNQSQKPGGPSVTSALMSKQRIKSVEESQSSNKTPDWGN